MSKVPSPKRQAILCHKLAVLLALSVEAMDELHVEADLGLEIKEGSEALMPKLEKFIEEVFGIPEVTQSTYLSQLSKKVDTLVRQNYQAEPEKEIY